MTLAIPTLTTGTNMFVFFPLSCVFTTQQNLLNREFPENFQHRESAYQTFHETSQEKFTAHWVAIILSLSFIPWMLTRTHIQAETHPCCRPSFPPWQKYGQSVFYVFWEALILVSNPFIAPQMLNGAFFSNCFYTNAHKKNSLTCTGNYFSSCRDSFPS